MLKMIFQQSGIIFHPLHAMILLKAAKTEEDTLKD